MNKIILELIALMIIWIACILIYHSSKIADYFNRSEKQTSLKRVKLAGVILTIIGMLLLYIIIFTY